MAMRLQAPLLLSTRFLLAASKAAVDRLAVEEAVCQGDQGCDLELMQLSQDLAEYQPSRAQIGQLLERMRPFAWYWAEQGGRQPSPASRPLSEYQARYKALRERVEETW
ncbi:unnamed protein product [Polarella glacialis]|uniref:Uncharacterized protein n=1 Tax=Polarella glacialis TaxID=89957 RepID=A0A813D4W1_POLGL|nr:unnamed protein product [Polarella glacialis]